jgi:hypothetical protein
MELVQADVGEVHCYKYLPPVSCVTIGGGGLATQRESFLHFSLIF